MDIHEWKRQQKEAKAAEKSATQAASAAKATPPSEVEKTFSGFMSNLGNDALSVGKGMAYPFTNTSEFVDGMKGLVVNEEGDFDLGGLADAGGAVVDRYQEIASDPTQSLYDQPLSTAMDIASLAFPVRGAAKLLPDGSMAQKVTEGAANVVQNMDPVSAVTTSLAAGNAALTNPVKTTETVVKPSNAKGSKQRDQGYREQVINSALERDITPNERGVAELQKQLDAQMSQIDAVLDNSPVQIPMDEITGGFAGWAKGKIGQTDVNYGELSDAIDGQSKKIKRQYAQSPDGQQIVSVNGRGLREMRQSADGEVNHNRVNQQNDSVKVQVDKLYASYLREKLADYIPEIGPLNAEVSTLLKVDDMYGPAFNRLSNNNPMGITTSMGTIAGGMAATSAGAATDTLWPMIAGTAMSMIPPLVNGVGPRINRSGSAHRSRKAGGGNNPVSGAVGALARDRNNLPFYMRQGGSFTDAMADEIMRQEEER
jgi:hypothetical protein